MTGTGTDKDALDEQVFEAVRGAYRDVRLGRALADIQRRHRRAPQRILVPGPRIRLVGAAAAAVMAVTVGSWLLIGRSDGGGGQVPASPLPSTSEQARGKPPRPTSTSTTDAGRCMDYVRAELDASNSGGHDIPPLRLALGEGQTRLLIFADDSVAITCWLSGDTFAVGGNPTAVNANAYPPGQLSYSSEDSGHDWGGGAFGRVPAGTTTVTISFPSGPDVVVTVSGEWFGYFTPPGPYNDRLADATKVSAATPSGEVSQPIQHG
ncbi:MAG TPA: hypothetical protein VF163_12935 [Micromonosporaceae bacterium]